jgi:enoyl-CoA hydratase
MSDWISLASADGVATVTMARPPVNAMSRRFMHDLAAAVEGAGTDPAVRVILIESRLPAMWSGGADIRELVGLDAAGCAAFIALGHDVFGRFGALPKPIVAAVNGVCVGGGLELAMACDIRIAAQSARFGQPEVDLGVISGWGGTQRLPRLIGKSRGLAMLMLGEPITADEALVAGLVWRVVPDATLPGEAAALARRLAAKPPLALARLKEAVERGLDRPLADGLGEEARAYVEAYLTRDAGEGIAAFLGKRPPRFEGH